MSDAVLEDWRMIPITLNKGTPRERKHPILAGKVNGKYRVIMLIEGFNPIDESILSGSVWYSIGKPDDKFDKAFPDSRNKFLQGVAHAVSKTENNNGHKT